MPTASGWVEMDRGAYKAVVRMPDGTRRTKRFSIDKHGVRAAKRLASDWKRDLCLAVERGTATPTSGRIPFADWVRDFRVSEKLTLRSNSLKQHDYIFTKHIIPAFGRMPLGDVTQSTVQKFIQSLTAKGLSAGTVRNCHQVLYRTFDAAVSAGALGRNPCQSIILPSPSRAEMRFLEPAEVATLASVIDKRYKALVVLGAYSGLRIGELAALRRQHLDLDEGVVSVRETLVVTKEGVTFGPPKTPRSVRRVPIPAPVVRLLTAHLAATLADDDLVFHALRGGPLRPDGWRDRTWKPAVVTAGLAPLTPHALRHTAVAIWIAADVSPVEIARRAGHTSTSTVLDLYGHLFQHGDKVFRDRVTQLYVPPK